jgi:hypothetical protein
LSSGKKNGWYVALLVCTASWLLLACNRQAPPPAVAEFSALTPAPELAKGGACGIDLVAGLNRELPQLSVSAGPTPVEFNGWAAIDVASAALGGQVQLILKGERSYEVATQRISREDVATYFKQPRMANSGYRVKVRMQGVAVGKYQVQLHIAQKEGASAMCQPLNTTLEVTGA